MRCLSPGFWLCVMLLATLASPVTAQESAPPPNILLLMADDLGYSDIGCYGGEIQTPNLDRLASEGLRFSQFYNNAKCIPTRASLLTGLYPRGPRPRVATNMVTIAEVLRMAGYQTALSGKWHLGATAPNRPIDRGFDEFYGLTDGCCNYFDPAERDPPFEGGRVRIFAHNDRRLSQFPPDFYTTDAFTDHAISTLRRFAASGRPFFLHVCFTAPHSPIQARPEEIEKYAGKYLDGWAALRQRRFARQRDLNVFPRQWDLPPADDRVYDWRSSNQHWEAQRMAVYAAMVDRMDQNIGRLLQALKDSQLDTNTLVMFLSDNGSSGEEAGGRDPSLPPGPKSSYMNVGPGWAWANNTPFRRYKTWVHEGGIATPFIVRWPGVVKPNTLIHDVGHVIDLLPTCVEVARTSYPARFNGNPILPPEGRSLVPLFRGKALSPPDLLFWEESGNRAVRQGRWKLVWDAGVGDWALYDVVADRTELNDLSRKRPSKVARLAAAYQRWAQATGRADAAPRRAKSQAAD